MIRWKLEFTVEGEIRFERENRFALSWENGEVAFSSYFTYNEQPLILRAQEAASNHNGELIFSANV